MSTPWQDLPRAHEATLVVGSFRSRAEDFCVDEVLDFLPTGSGEHALLRIEKRGHNTEDLAHALARSFDVPRMAVSFAGRKDRHAVTRQWFSVHTPSDAVPTLPSDCSVLEQTRHARKLRRGEIRRNEFRIRLQLLEGHPRRFDARIEDLKARGVPNYFGEQRFGHDGANVGRAYDFLVGNPRRRISAFDKGLHLSVARSLLFNAVLAHRVRGATWETSLPGEVEIDGLPSGPLWGRGRSATASCCAALETEALRDYRAWMSPLEHVGLVQERRSLVLHPQGLAADRAQGWAELSFALGPGQYATSLIRELGCFSEPGLGVTRP